METMENLDLNELRNEINEIDAQLVPLFLKRMGVSLKVAQYKQANHKPVLDRTRERELLKRVGGMAEDADLGLYTRLLYADIMGLSRSYQRKYLENEMSAFVKKVQNAVQSPKQLDLPEEAIVACQGVEGAYSSLACARLFKRPDILFFDAWEGVFSAVQQGLCQYGILPIENSTAGSVNHVYDLMNQYKFHIVKSVRLKVEHALLAKKGVRLSEIKEIFSHEQAINQCSLFLNGLSGVKVTVCENTAAAAKRVAESDRRDIAAISSKDCMELYGLSALCENIQNSDSNYTRFICIGKDLEIFPGACKTSLMLTLPHKPGALYDVLSRFYALDINLLKLESRPRPHSDFEFRFYFDVEASVYSENFLRMLSELEASTEQFCYLGSYTEIL